MTSTNRLLLLSLAALIAGAACSKKKSDSPAAAPVGASAPTQQTTTTSASPLTLTRNADGSAQIEVALVDGNGVRTVHRGRITPQNETEIRSDDGKSLAAVRAYDNYAFIMIAQYQVDRSEARVYIFAGNPKNTFDLILNGLVLERNGALAKVDSVLGEVARLCSYNGPQALASLSQFFRANPSSNLDQFVESKRQEIKDSGSDRQCVSANLTTDPNDGHVRVTWGARNPPSSSNNSSHGGSTNGGGNSSGGSYGDSDSDEPVPPSQRPSNGTYHEREDRPVTSSGSAQQQAPCPPQQQAPGQQPYPPVQPPAQQYPQPPYQPPAQQAPPSAQQPPGQPYPPVQPPAQQAPPSAQQPPAQQAPPVAQQPAPPQSGQQGSPEQQVGNGSSSNWQACYDAGKWSTHENHYCRQKWWSGCSPETGGTVCKVKGSKASDDSSHGTVSEPSTPAQTGSSSSQGEWTQDFNICYAAGKWKTDGNNYCKEWFWPNCSPDRGANRCLPQP